ncbi:MAG: ABC transporter substrate-binding protein [Deltaproteobacteria bacterium]|nr:ABC transporter substrate-binding protein [Deltaproteobacteria bacterium]
MKKRIFCIFVTIVVLSMLCFAVSVPAAEKVKELKLGLNVPLSGPAADWGLTSKHAAEFLRQKIEEQGGLKVGNDVYKLVVVPYDSKYVAADALANARRHTFEDKIKFQWILGGGVVPSCQPITEKEKVLVLACAYGGKKVTNPDKPYTFRTIIGSDLACPIAFPYLAKNYPKIKKIAFIGPNDDCGFVSIKDGKAAAEAVGWEVVGEEVTERTLVDYLPVITRLLRGKPDIIHAACSPTDQVALATKAARELGYEGYIFADATKDPDKVMEIAGEYSDGIFFVNCINQLINPAVADLDARTKKTFGRGLMFGAIEYHASMQAWAQAIERAGTLDTDAVVKELESGTFDTVYGPITFGGKPLFGIKRQVLHPVPLGLIKGGKFVALDLMPIPAELK